MRYYLSIILILMIFAVGCSKESTLTDTGSNGVSPVDTGISPAVNVPVSELALHNQENDCWISYEGAVYDVTDFLPDHPGTAAMIVPYCGTSSAFENAFTTKHGTSKVSMLEKVGVYKGQLG